MECELNCLDRFSTEFDHCQLNDDCRDQYNQEQRIVKEMFENVDFCDFQLSCVDFIEDL